MDVVDARSGALVRVGQTCSYSHSPEDDWSLVRVEWRSPLTRTALVRRGGVLTRVTMPVKLLPKVTYGADFPSAALWCAIFPS